MYQATEDCAGSGASEERSHRCICLSAVIHGNMRRVPWLHFCLYRWFRDGNYVAVIKDLEQIKDSIASRYIIYTHSLSCPHALQYMKLEHPLIGYPAILALGAEHERAQWVNHDGSTTDCTMSGHSTTELHLAPSVQWWFFKILFNDAFNTFYLRLYGIKQMVKDQSDSERGNLLLPRHQLIFSISSKGYFICNIQQAG